MNTREPDLPMDDVSTAYREAMHDSLREEPSHAIDDAIRAAARRAVAAGPQQVKKSWFARHTTPLAAAATVLLTGSLLLVANREQPNVLTQPMDGSASVVADSGVMARQAELRERASVVEGNQPLVPVAPASPALTTQPVAKAALPVAKSEMAKMRESQLVPPTSLLRQEKIANAAPAVSASSAVVASPPPAVAASTPAFQPPVPASAEAVADKPAVVAATAGTSAAVAMAPVLAAPPTPVAAAAAPAAPPAPAPAKPVAVARQATMAPASANAVAPQGEASGVRGFSGSVSAESKKMDAVETVESWINRLAVLQSDGKTAQLHDELRRFRKAYPTNELPKTLQDEWVRISP